MRKYLLGLLLTLLIATPVSAYVVRSGDTPYGLWGASWRTELSKYGISDPRKLPVGLEVNSEPTLGISGLDVIALFEDNLQNTIASSDTTMTLVRGTDKVGNNIVGTFGFIIDEGTTLEEFVIATCSGTACTSMLRGISVIDSKTEVASLKKAHRKGASVKMTNYPILGRINRIITGYESTGSSTFMIGNDTNVDMTLRFSNGATNTPEMVYDATTNQLKFRRSGETAYTEIPLSLRGTYANYAALPVVASEGDIAITSDDNKLYTYDLSGTTWVLAGGSSGAGTVYKTEKLGSESDGGDLKTFTLTAGSWPDEKFLLVYKNGQAQRIGATYDYTEIDSNTIQFTTTLASDDLVQMVVVSVDLYNPAWTAVNDNIIPDTDNAYDLGTATKTFKDVYVTGTVYTKNLNISSNLTVTNTTTLNGVNNLATTTISNVDFTDNLSYGFVTSSISMSDGGHYAQTLNCQNGSRILSGGFMSSNSSYSMYLASSYPASSTAWTFDFTETQTGGTNTVTTYAICIKL